MVSYDFIRFLLDFIWLLSDFIWFYILFLMFYMILYGFHLLLYFFLERGIYETSPRPHQPRPDTVARLRTPTTCAPLPITAGPMPPHRRCRASPREARHPYYCFAVWTPNPICLITLLMGCNSSRLRLCIAGSGGARARPISIYIYIYIYIYMARWS